MTTRPFLRAGVLAAAIATLIGLTATPALAHVTVHPGHADEGGYAKLTFRVPNEEDHASTTKLQVVMPRGTPIAHVSVKPHPGWSFQVDTTTLDTPIRTSHGTVRRVVSRITWTADSPEAAIKPGEFDEFAVSAGRLPAKATTLRFPAIQTYSDGDVVRWIQTAAPGAPEPKHPAPTLRVRAAGEPTGGHATAARQGSDSGDAAALALSIAALVLAVGAAAGAGYVLVRRRS